MIHICIYNVQQGIEDFFKAEAIEIPNYFGRSVDDYLNERWAWQLSVMQVCAAVRFLANVPTELQSSLANHQLLAQF